MGSNSVSLTKSQFMSFFGELGNLLKDSRKPEGCFFLTEVAIRDIYGSDEIEVGFGIEYGPIACRDSYGGVDAEMLDCRFRYIYKKNGDFVKELGTEPSSFFDFGPRYGYPPAFEDLPDPEDTELNVFCVISNIITKCVKCGKLLNSIQFVASSPEFSYEYNPGTPYKGEDAGEAESFYGEAHGISLTEDMKDSYTYCYTLTPSKAVKGEWELVFWVKV